METDGATANDPHDLARFVTAQDRVWDNVRAELAGGRKRTHWMWFVFPQMRGLGRSPTARYYAIAGLDEARAYLAHPTLGARLHEATELVLRHEDRPLYAIFGSPDDLKLVSSMTLFEAAEGEGTSAFGNAGFGNVLARMNGGGRDRATLDLLALSSTSSGRM